MTDLKQGRKPRVTDNDAGEITVSLSGRELRGWSYKDDAERRTKMLCAREYVEGWYATWKDRDTVKDAIGHLHAGIAELKRCGREVPLGFNRALHALSYVKEVER